MLRQRGYRVLVVLLLVAVLSALTGAEVWAADRPFVLVIDAGHGGHDAGALGASSKEKNINLAVALLFGKYVERNCKDVKVVYTRTTDTFVTLQGRASIANKAKADLFISVHTNAVAKGKTVRGFEVYTLGMHRAADNLAVAQRENSVITLEDGYKERYAGFDPNSSESYIMFEYMQDKNMERSVDLAKLIESNVCAAAGRVNRGVHQAGFLVLRETSMPSVLIELGYISTPDEERQLNDAQTQDKIAQGIFKAFQAYRSKTAQGGSNTVTVAADDDEATSAPAALPTTTTAPATTATKDSAAPVFKIQIFGTSKALKKSDTRFRGLSPVDHYKEGGLYKYTYGSTTDYAAIAALRRQISSLFPDAFIIAFRGNNRMDINEAIAYWQQHK